MERFRRGFHSIGEPCCVTRHLSLAALPEATALYSTVRCEGGPESASSPFRRCITTPHTLDLERGHSLAPNTPIRGAQSALLQENAVLMALT